MDSITFRVSYTPETATTISQALQRLAPLVNGAVYIWIDSGVFFGRPYSIIADDYRVVCSDSPPLFSLTPFLQLWILHLAFSDGCASFHYPISMTWLEATFRSIVLPTGIALCLTITTNFSLSNRHLDWEVTLDTALSHNPTILVKDHRLQSNGLTVGGRIIEYTLISGM